MSSILLQYIHPLNKPPCSIAIILNIIAAQALYYITFNAFAWNGRRGSDGGIHNPCDLND